ncbi:hypothetical protein HPB47_016358 [Ixodes persulcatus]|uniref:Uncharacterized protein n=1 Tax=Ixodes persulcatus TaxID=34615 RepID=A0AC60QR84_IXOPE|nr:hypothetical protein HPB47_016358 [Ixodes persulcatus]
MSSVLTGPRKHSSSLSSLQPEGVSTEALDRQSASLCLLPDLSCSSGPSMKSIESGAGGLACHRFGGVDRRDAERRGDGEREPRGAVGAGDGGRRRYSSMSLGRSPKRGAPSVNVVSLPAEKAHRTSVIRAPHVGLSRSTLLLARSVLRRRDFSSGCSWVLPGDRRLRTTNNCGVGHSWWFRCGVGENVWLERLLDPFSNDLGDRE